MSATTGGLLGIFDGLDTTLDAIGRLKKAGHRQLTVFSPLPSHELEHVLRPPKSPVRLFTLVGGLTGTATGFALPTWTSMDWPLVTGGKPIISLPAWVIIAFELTILFGALSTVAGMLIVARLPNRKPLAVYDPSFSSDRFGVYVRVPADRDGEVRQVLREAGALEVREQHG
jgi:hypothetical protein